MRISDWSSDVCSSDLGPGSKVYGRLSVMLQAFCDVTSLFTIGPGAFRPPPKVDSAVMRLVPRDPALIGIDDRKRFADVVRAAFGQPRKTLSSEERRVGQACVRTCISGWSRYN